jgi:hypothetical protein
VRAVPVVWIQLLVIVTPKGGVASPQLLETSRLDCRFLLSLKTVVAYYSLSERGKSRLFLRLPQSRNWGHSKPLQSSLSTVHGIEYKTGDGARRKYLTSANPLIK